jgi:hypothetical protein
MTSRTAQALTDIDGQAFAREPVEHCERAEPSPIGELIGHEVHTPDVIASGRWASLLAMYRGGVSPRTLALERKPLLSLESIARFFPSYQPSRRSSTRRRRKPNRTRVCASSRMRCRNPVNGSRQLWLRRLDRQKRAARVARRSLTSYRLIK